MRLEITLTDDDAALQVKVKLCESQDGAAKMELETYSAGKLTHGISEVDRRAGAIARMLGSALDYIRAQVDDYSTIDKFPY